jgi:hypothetical protein
VTQTFEKEKIILIFYWHHHFLRGESEGVQRLWDWDGNGEGFAIGSGCRRRPMDDCSTGPSPCERSARSAVSTGSEGSGPMEALKHLKRT